MAGISKVLCVSEYCASSELLYSENELPFFKTKEECLNKINFFLNNEVELKNATEKFYKRSLDFEDSKYINQIKKFIDGIKIDLKHNFNTPFWYNYLFLKQSLRLRFKNNQLLSFLREFMEILFSIKKYNLREYIKILICSFYLFFRYLPFLLIKKINIFSK